MPQDDSANVAAASDDVDGHRGRPGCPIRIFCARIRGGSSWLMDPKLIHVGKGKRIGHLKLVPALKIGGAHVAHRLRPIFLKTGYVQLEAEKLQFILVEK